MPDFDKATRKQKRAAEMFADSCEHITLIKAVEYLDECFALATGEMSEAEFEAETGLMPHGVRFKRRR